MAQNSNTTSLYTTVKNTSGVAKVFGFLGERGKRLAVDESYTQRGNLISKLGAQTSKRRFQALERSLEEGRLEIISTPGVHVYDATLDETKVLAIDNGILGVVDPTWLSSGSSEFEEADAA